MLAPPINSTSETLEDRLLLEQARAFIAELHRVADAAPDGQVLRIAERFTVEKGREFLRCALAQVLQSQANAVEKKVPPPAPVPAATVGTTRAARPNSA
jgi:hypothetical protein